MTFSQWIEGGVGRTSRMAEYFGIAPAAVTQWKINGVPTRRMKAVREYTRGAVTLEEMVPESKPVPVREAA